MMSSRPMPRQVPGRYEFRCWPAELPPAASLLQRDWFLTNAEIRSDIYLLSPYSGLHLAKLRDGKRLEIKSLRATPHPLQYWELTLSDEFPLSRNSLGALGTELGLTPTPDIGAGRSPAHLMAHLAETHAAIRIETVDKSTITFQRGSTRAGITFVTRDQFRALSISVEDEDPQLAIEAVSELGLAGYPNQSFGEMLSPRRLESMMEEPVPDFSVFT
jgi:hypothetical protein